MINLKELLLENFLTPIKAMRWRYLPLLFIYFAYGISTFAGIALTFWIKDTLGLSAIELAAVAVWLALPWTIKMIFGQFADSLKFFGSQRKVYVYFGAFLMIIGTLTLVGITLNLPWLLAIGTPSELYVFSMMIIVIGTVMQDVIADVMTTEVVDREGRTEDEIKFDLGMVQVLGRLAITFAAFMVAGLGGWLAANFTYTTIFLLLLIVPALSIIGVSLIKLDPVPKKPINWKVMGGGIIFAIFSAFMGLSSIPFGQELVIVASLSIVCFLIHTITKDLDSQTKMLIISAIIVIFVFRAMPGIGVGGQWWMIDSLGFTREFFGVLAQIGATLAIFGMWFFSRYITTKPVGTILAWLVIFTTILEIPIIGMFYGLHDFLGLAPQTIALVDTAIVAPFEQLSMIPMLTLIAIYAPKGNAATWFALMASLMNLALSVGAVGTKYLNMIFVIERGSYAALGPLMITSASIGFVIPLVVIFLFMTPQGKDLIRFAVIFIAFYSKYCYTKICAP